MWTLLKSSNTEAEIFQTSMTQKLGEDSMKEVSVKTSLFSGKKVPPFKINTDKKLIAHVKDQLLAAYGDAKEKQ